MINKFSAVNSSFYGPNYDVSDFLAPVYTVIEAGNSLVDVIVYCETTNFAKQFSNRFTTWSGLLDFTSTIGSAFIKQAASAGNSNLYNAGETFFTATTCARTARALGELFHYSVYFEIQDDNYEEYLLTNITP